MEKKFPRCTPSSRGGEGVKTEKLRLNPSGIENHFAYRGEKKTKRDLQE